MSMLEQTLGLDQETGPPLLRLGMRRYNALAADLFARKTPRLPFTIVITEACGAQSDQALRNLLSTVASIDDPDQIQPAVTQQLTDDQAPTLQILLSGRHAVEDAFVIVGGNAVVELNGRGIALVFGSARVTSRGEYEVYAIGDAKLTAYDKSRIDADGNVEVKSFDYVQGVARGNVTGVARGNSQWQAANAANFAAYDRAQVIGNDDVVLRGFGNSRVTGFGRTRASLFERASGWFDGEAMLDIHGGSVSYVTSSVKVTGRSGTPQLLPWERG